MITKEDDEKDNKSNITVGPDEGQTLLKEKIVQRESSMEYLNILHELQTSYPLAFPVDKTKLVPLKIGIRLDILANTALVDKLSIDEIALSKFMHGYVMRKSYLIKQIAGACRYDLTGVEIGEVSAQQAAFAVIRLKRKLLKKQKRLSNFM